MSKLLYILAIGAVDLTGTFFWESTTAQSFPLTPTDVILAAVIALNAYSAGKDQQLQVHIFCAGLRRSRLVAETAM